MFQRDYITHMIEEFARMLGKALGLREDDMPGEAYRLIRQSYTDFFKLNAEFFDEIAPENIVAALTARPDFSLAHFDMLAQGFKTEGDLLHETHPELATDRYAKALAIYRHLEIADRNTYSLQRKEAIEQLLTHLN
ncbi:MAG: hypothetical protein ACRCYO_14745 [Bacteroidia bacterium]